MKNPILQSWFALMQANLFSGAASVADIGGYLPEPPLLPLRDPREDRQRLAEDFQKVAQDFRHALEREVSRR